MSTATDNTFVIDFSMRILWCISVIKDYSKTCLKRSLSKRPKLGFQEQLSLNAGQKYCIMLQWGHSAILSTCIKLSHGLKTFVSAIFE